MTNNEKPGGGGKDQPFIPKGHGSESGQYCKKQTNDYVKSEHCTERELKAILSSDELRCIKLYSNFEYGIALNKAIRENKMTKADEAFRDGIVSAIRKHRLEKPLTVYRGIRVSHKVFLRNFVVKYILDKPIVGSTICSTSRRYTRAAAAAQNDDPKFDGILFEINLPKGYRALPIEDVSVNAREQEILLSSPRYLIEDIDDCASNGYHFKKIKIKLIGDDENEN